MKNNKKNKKLNKQNKKHKKQNATSSNNKSISKQTANEQKIIKQKELLKDERHDEPVPVKDPFNRPIA